MKKWKICGITNKEDAQAAISANAFVIGCVFHPESRRFCDPRTATTIAEESPVPVAAVFAYNPLSYIREIVSGFSPPFYIQTPADHPDFADILRIFPPEIITPVYLVDSGFSIQPIASDVHIREGKYPYIIFDTGGVKDSGGNPMAGGTGKTFSWEIIREVDYPFLIAGGLNKSNIPAVLDFLENTQGMGIDISGGLEKSPGFKDHILMKELSPLFTRE